MANKVCSCRSHAVEAEEAVKAVDKAAQVVLAVEMVASLLTPLWPEA